MRDEDEVFAEIVSKEFNETWTPPPPPVAPAPEAPAGPLPDFHLNLYDDDESYREVQPWMGHLSPRTWTGLALVGVGLAISIAKFTPLYLPLWAGWAAVGCFVAGVSIALWELIHRPPSDDDPEGTV